MNFRKLLLGIAAALALTSAPAIAQTVPKVSTINPGVDLIQIVPNGQPTSIANYATVSQVLTGTTNADGLGSTVPVTGLRAATALPMTGSATGGAFGVAITAGTSYDLVGEAANSSTKTDTVAFELVLPPSYVANQNITVTVNCKYNLGSGTIGTHTLTGHAYLTAADGTQGSDLVTTAAGSVPASAGNVTFTIPGTGLVAGNRLWVTAVMVIQDTGGSNITGQVNSISLS